MKARPVVSPKGDIVAKISFLVLQFEERRAKLLGMPFGEGIHTIIYEEHWDYYATLYTSEIWGDTLSPHIMVDAEMRDFFQRGLSSTAFSVCGCGEQVEVVGQIKTKREIGILKAVNTGTVDAIRAMRPCLQSGLMEKAVAEVPKATLAAAGLEPFFAIVEFHGGYDGTRKV